MRIAIILIFISIQTAGIVSETKLAFGNDLQVSFENEVAGVTPEMTLLPEATGNLDQPGLQIAKVWGSSKKHPNETRASISGAGKKFHANPYASAGWISNTMQPVGKVLKIMDNKPATTGPESVFINIGRRQGVELGDKFTVYSPERFVSHPVIGLKRELWGSHPKTRQPGFPAKELWSLWGKPLGYRIAIRGVLEVTEVGDTASYANLIKVYEDIKTGEFLIPYQVIIEPPQNISSDRNIDGYIVATKTDKLGVAYNDIVYIDKGWEDGVQAGHSFEVYRIQELVEKTWYRIGSFKKQLLPEVLGELKVVSTQKHTATAVIVQNNRDMEVGNRIRIKR